MKKLTSFALMFLFCFVTLAQAQTASPAKPLPDVVAIANGVQIKIKDIDEPIIKRIEELQKQVVVARKRELDLQINSKLLEAEAKRRGTTANKLLDAEVAPKAKPVSEADAQRLYEENKARIKGEFAQIKPQLIQYLERQESRRAELSFAEQLRKQATIEVFLTQPEKLPSKPR